LLPEVARTLEKGKPSVTAGRKAKGLSNEIA